jgi:hypothetical protein
MRRRHLAGEDRLGLTAVVLLWKEQRNLGVVAIRPAEEGQSLYVIPVEMGEQDAADEGGPVE